MKRIWDHTEFAGESRNLARFTDGYYKSVPQDAGGFQYIFLESSFGGSVEFKVTSQIDVII